MDARYEHCGEVMVVELNGRLDFETAVPFRKTCLGPLVREKVVFDMRNLNFVGSLGLKDFVDTLDHMAQSAPANVKFCGVSVEFRRLFEASGISRLSIFENRESAVRSFTSAPELAGPLRSI